MEQAEDFKVTSILLNGTIHLFIHHSMNFLILCKKHIKILGSENDRFKRYVNFDAVKFIVRNTSQDNAVFFCLRLACPSCVGHFVYKIPKL